VGGARRARQARENRQVAFSGMTRTTLRNGCSPCPALVSGRAVRRPRNIAVVSHIKTVERPARSCIVVDRVSEASGPAPEPVERTRGALASDPAGSPAALPAAPWWAWGVLLLVSAMNLLDSGDHWLLAAVLPEMRSKLDLSESLAGWLPTIVLLSLAISSPFIGYVVDRFSRPRLLSMGFAVWSLATVSTGLGRTIEQLQLARVLVGFGGAISAVVALALIMDLFPRTIRARALGVYFLAVPLGAALALSFGAALAQVTNWQLAFLTVGAPGLLLALLALVIPDPTRGLSEGVDIERVRLHEQVGASPEDYTDLMVNSSYTYSLFGITFSSFALAGLSYWSRAFLTVAKGLPEAVVDPTLGISFLGAAILGTLAGGLLGEWSSRRNVRALFIVPGLAMFGAIVFVLVAVYARWPPAIFGGLTLAIVATFLNIVPCYTIISSVTMPNMRGAGCGVALAAVNLLGAIWSPTLMGWVADTFGQRDAMATGFGQALEALGARPVARPGLDPQNLTAAMLVVVPALLIAGSVLLAGSRHLPREMALLIAKLRATPSRLAGNRKAQSRP
jgi:MFS transporter, Spinster family, sphingosine-1-phosphate transporter